MADKPAAREQRIAAAKQQQQQKGDDKPPETPKERAEAALDKDAENKRLSEARPEPRSMDDPMRVLARRAVEIAEAGGASLGSAITAPQAQLIKDRLGGNPSEKFAPATLAQLQAYAQGGRGEHRTDIPAEAVEKLRTFSRESGSRRIWPRKVAAMVLALDEQRTGRARPGTKKKAEAEQATAEQPSS